MTAEHLEIIVEEPSMEAFLEALLPSVLGEKATFRVYPHQCKDDLIKHLPSRLIGYGSWLPDQWRIVVVVDCDNDECTVLKQQLEDIVDKAGLRSRARFAHRPWQIVTRVAIEELEAWYFGDWVAVRQIYPRVNPSIPAQALYRNPDSIRGGTWEAFERCLQRAGYFKGGLRKIEAARLLGKAIDPYQNRSPSFVSFRDAIMEAVTDPSD
jgi:hypothetical protein